MIVQSVKWVGGIDGFLELVDQRRLPGKFVKLRCHSIEQLYKAIKTLTVRGAPAIGVAAAYGLVLALKKLPARVSLEQAIVFLGRSYRYLASSRPTAVNLSWALERVRQKAVTFVVAKPKATLLQLRKFVLAEADAIYKEDVDMCRRIGQNGQKFIRPAPIERTGLFGFRNFGERRCRAANWCGVGGQVKNGYGILTHCNAGALATAGQGTALSIIFEAHKRQKKFTVYVDETRPLLQGARLTAWELKQAGIDVVVICDNMAGWLMKQGKINAVITGADRIAANGDAANKIGTYSLSILAKKHRIPFYIAAPSSTFDLNIKTGAQIPIEQRPAEEVTRPWGTNKRIVPTGVRVYNPAFDVTEAKVITAIITERGVIKNPDAKKIAAHFGKPRRKPT